MCRPNYSSVCFLLCKWSALSSCWNKLVLWSPQLLTEEFKSDCCMCAIPKPRKNVSKGVFQTVRAFLCHENINAHWSIITICIFIVIYRNSYVSMEGFWTVKGLFLDIRTIVTQSLKDSEMCTFKTVHYFLIRNYFSLSMKRSFKLRVTIWL